MPRVPLTPSLIAVATVGVLAAGAALLVARPTQAAPEGQAATGAPRPALAVTLTQPLRAPVRLRLPATGSVAAWQEAVIGAESNGLRLAEVRVNVGDSVRAGQVLALFAPETVQADVAQAQASLLEAQAHAAEAAANNERARTLTASGALSQQQIQQYATAAQTAQARVAAAQAALNAQQLRVRHTQVLAPDRGVISARTATVGAVVPAGTELFRMVRQGRLEWRAEVSATELPRIQRGTPVLITAASGAQVEGTVRMLAPTVDPKTRNALVYVDLPSLSSAAGQAATVLPGMFARGEFLLGEREALSVPQTAVVVRDGFSHVFEIAEGQRVVMRRVQTGQRVGERVEIVSGLRPEARIVERGGAFLNDGDLVRVTAGPAADLDQKPAQVLAAPEPAASK